MTIQGQYEMSHYIVTISFIVHERNSRIILTYIFKNNKNKVWTFSTVILELI